MQFSTDKNACICPPITQSSCPPPCPPSSPIENGCSKYYQEIGAEMIGNQLLIRLEKDKSRPKRKQHEWDPPCDCVEIQRPTSKRGPKIINADYEDRVIFRVQPSSQFDKDEESTYHSQTIAYKIESCRSEQDSHRCKTITVYPQKSVPGSQEVYTNHTTERNQDIFLLRVKKKTEYPDQRDQRDRNVELELRTPKPPKLSKLPTPSSTQPIVAPLQSITVANLVVENVKEPENSKKSKKQLKKKAKRK